MSRRKRFVILNLPDLPYEVEVDHDLIRRYGRDRFVAIARDLVPSFKETDFQPCVPFRPEMATSGDVNVYFVPMPDRCVVALLLNKAVPSGVKQVRMVDADALGITLGIKYESEPGFYRERPK